MVMNYFREKILFFILFYYKEMVLDYCQEEKKKSNLIPQNILHVRHVPNPITFNIYIYIYLLVNLYLFKW